MATFLLGFHKFCEDVNKRYYERCSKQNNMSPICSFDRPLLRKPVVIYLSNFLLHYFLIFIRRERCLCLPLVCSSIICLQIVPILLTHLNLPWPLGAGANRNGISFWGLGYTHNTVYEQQFIHLKIQTSFSPAKWIMKCEVLVSQDLIG